MPDIKPDIKLRTGYMYQIQETKTRPPKRVYIHDKDTILFVGSVQGEGEKSEVVLFHADGQHVYDPEFNITKELHKVSEKDLKK